MCRDLLEQTTGIKVDEKRGQEILETFESFQKFVINAGGSLIDPEVWVLVSFLGWSNECMALVAEEARLLRALKKAVVAQEKEGTISVTQEMQELLRKLFQEWTGG